MWPLMYLSGREQLDHCYHRSRSQYNIKVVLRQDTPWPVFTDSISGSDSTGMVARPGRSTTIRNQYSAPAPAASFSVSLRFTSAVSPAQSPSHTGASETVSVSPCLSILIRVQRYSASLVIITFFPLGILSYCLPPVSHFHIVEHYCSTSIFLWQCKNAHKLFLIFWVLQFSFRIFT